jgi:hypothetical protein
MAQAARADVHCALKRIGETNWDFTSTTRTMKLISYCLPTDDGAAPNPFWDVCTLAICKPVIRRVTAAVGDWVVGVGSKNVLYQKDESYINRLIYAMKVTKIMSLKEYDDYAKAELPGKLPDSPPSDAMREVGDCIYDFSNGGVPVQRKSVHHSYNVPTDLGGKNVLLSNHFYYFGRDAIEIPAHLQTIVIQHQGHKFKPNEPIKDKFIEWISGYTEGVNALPYGFKNSIEDSQGRSCGARRHQEDAEDEILAECGN